MKRITLFAVLGFCLAVPSLVMAQSEYNHAGVGVFADYFRFSTPNPNINFVGVVAASPLTYTPISSWKRR